MKHISVLALSALSTVGAIPFSAYATPLSHLYASSVAAHNVAVIQHSLTLNAFNKFDGIPSNTLGRKYVNKDAENDTSPNSELAKNYGQMSIYGAYGDDGTVFSTGRNGGDTSTLTNTWFDYQHVTDHAKFKHFDSIESNRDMATFGIVGGHNQISGGFSEWGAFGGIVFATEEDTQFKLSENGGYAGLYSGYHMYGFNIMMAANIGGFFNEAKSTFGTDDYTNLWTGVSFNASYDIVLDNTFTLQPGVYIGHTWLRSSNYTAKSGQHITTDNFNMFEISPSLRAIKHIVDDWYGTLSARYVFNFTDGGDVAVAGTVLPELELMNYSEYGMSIEKNIERLNIGASLTRRDGGRTGWTGGLHIRYMF